MTQAPATPELVERLREHVRYEYMPAAARLAMEQAADTLEAQQARIAELEVENERLRLTMLGGEDVAGFASSLPLAQVLDSFRTYETALRDSANSAQALADRYEKALRETRTDLVILRGNIAHAARQEPRWDGMPEMVGEWVGRIDQALSSQGRREGEQDSSSRSQPCADAQERSPGSLHSGGIDDDCPHAGTFRYCAECPVSPCPLGLGRGDNQ